MRLEVFFVWIISSRHYFLTFYWVKLIVCRSYPMIWMKTLIVFEEEWRGWRFCNFRIFSRHFCLILVLEKEWCLALLWIVKFQEVARWHLRFETFLNVKSSKRSLSKHHFRWCFLSLFVGVCWWYAIYLWICSWVNNDCRFKCEWMGRKTQFLNFSRQWTIVCIDKLGDWVGVRLTVVTSNLNLLS